jgi:hypothetical protein
MKFPLRSILILESYGTSQFRNGKNNLRFGEIQGAYCRMYKITDLSEEFSAFSARVSNSSVRCTYLCFLGKTKKWRTPVMQERWTHDPRKSFINMSTFEFVPKKHHRISLNGVHYISGPDLLYAMKSRERKISIHGNLMVA